jgi:hypothetical protein
MDVARLAEMTSAAAPGRRKTRPVVQLVWLVAGLALSFAIPFIGSDVLVLPLTLYYLLYFVLVLAFLGAYVRFTGFDVGALIRRRWSLSLALGLLAGAFVVSRVLTEAATPGPRGARYVFELLWRGAFYGTVDALLLTVFPCLVVLGLLGGDVRGAARKLVYFAGSLAIVLTITAVYHLGFEQFRRDGIVPPEIGNTVISLPMLLTTNPIGSVLAHTSMHITATAHAYETPTFLPPQVTADDRRAAPATR